MKTLGDIIQPSTSLHWIQIGSKVDVNGNTNRYWRVFQVTEDGSLKDVTRVIAQVLKCRTLRKVDAISSSEHPTSLTAWFGREFNQDEQFYTAVVHKL